MTTENLQLISFDSRPALDIIQAAPGAGQKMLSSYPCFSEYARSGHLAKVAVGALGSLEANLSYNMDYSSGMHRFYDQAKNAYWTALNEAGYYLQYAPANTASGDIWDNAGCHYGFHFTVDKARFGGDILPFVNGISKLGCVDAGYKQLYVDYTNTDVVGNVTINKAAGRVNVEAGQSSVIVTNSLCTANAEVFAVVATMDASSSVKSVTPSAGSFQIILNIPATAQTAVSFFIVNTD